MCHIDRNQNEVRWEEEKSSDDVAVVSAPLCLYASFNLLNSAFQVSSPVSSCLFLSLPTCLRVFTDVEENN